VKFKRQKAEDRGQKAEGRKQKGEGRREKGEGRRENPEDRNQGNLGVYCVLHSAYCFLRGDLI